MRLSVKGGQINVVWKFEFILTLESLKDFKQEHNMVGVMFPLFFPFFLLLSSNHFGSGHQVEGLLRQEERTVGRLQLSGLL